MGAERGAGCSCRCGHCRCWRRLESLCACTPILFLMQKHLIKLYTTDGGVKMLRRRRAVGV